MDLVTFARPFAAGIHEWSAVGGWSVNPVQRVAVIGMRDGDTTVTFLCVAYDGMMIEADASALRFRVQPSLINVAPPVGLHYADME